MPEIPTTARGLLARLERYYVKAGSIGAGGMFAAEVGHNGTWGQGRRCDALYAGFTSSSGRVLVGHEVKISVADWRHELDQVEKADEWADACHEWWIVAPSVKIVDPATLPDGWGLMVPNPRGSVRFDKVVRARTRQDFNPPWWAVRSFMARLDTLNIGVTRGIAGTIVAEEVTRQRERDARAAAADPRGERRLTEDEKHGLRVLASFKTSGIDLGDWSVSLDPDALAKVWPHVLAARDAERLIDRLATSYRGAAAVLEAAQELVAAVEKIRTPPLASF